MRRKRSGLDMNIVKLLYRTFGEENHETGHGAGGGRATGYRTFSTFLVTKRVSHMGVLWSLAVIKTWGRNVREGRNDALPLEDSFKDRLHGYGNLKFRKRSQEGT